MSNYNLSVHQIEVNGCNERMFIEFFSIDSDFAENEDYWREDTLELGFKSEAERCSKELFEKHKDAFYVDGYIETLSTALEEAGNYFVEGTQHIYGNDTYTSQSEMTIICMDEDHNDYIVVVSMMSK